MSKVLEKTKFVLNVRMDTIVLMEKNVKNVQLVHIVEGGFLFLEKMLLVLLSRLHVLVIPTVRQGNPVVRDVMVPIKLLIPTIQGVKIALQNSNQMQITPSA